MSRRPIWTARPGRHWSHWYSHRRWRRVRARQLKAEPLCRHCLDQGQITVATEVDHIEPHKGDRLKFWKGALQSLCKACHSRKTAREEGKQVAPSVSVTGEPEGWQ